MRRALSSSALLALSALSLVIACNAISGLDEDFTLVPFDGGGEGTDATLADGAPADDAGGGTDVTTTDAPADAPADVFTCDGGDAANVVFCTDFETDAAWTADELDNGTVTFELDAGAGGSRAMHAHVDDATGVSRRAALWKKIAGTDAKTYRHYDIAFEFMIAGKTFPYAALGVFGVTQPAGGGGLRFYGPASYGDRTIDVAEDSPQIVAGQTSVDDIAGTWHRAFITVDREGAGTYAMSLAIDATVVDSRTGFDFGDAQTAELRIGILFTSTSSGTMDLYVDNVVVHREP